MEKSSASASGLLVAMACLVMPLKAESLDVNYSGSVRMRYETLNNPIFPTNEDVANVVSRTDRTDFRVCFF